MVPKNLLPAITAACVLSLGIGVTVATACSTFAVTAGPGLLFGRNTDSPVPIPGFVVVNKRGISKTALPWALIGPAGTDPNPVRWTSKFGSLTFSHFGREFPDGGVNEAGLVIEEMTLNETRYSTQSTVGSMVVQQWLQFQLDSFATVQEVAANANRFAIRGWPWHFTVADANGNCATIEFIDGKPVVSKGVLKDTCILTNDTLAEARKRIPPNGTNAMEKSGSSDSMSRFVRAYQLLDRPLPKSREERASFGFDVLQKVSQGSDTRRSILYDLEARRVYFKSNTQPKIKWVSLAGLDFRASTPVKMIEIDTPRAGDVTHRMRQYRVTDNRRAVDVVFGLVRADPQLSAALNSELKSAGLSERQYKNRIADYPSTTRAN